MRLVGSSTIDGNLYFFIRNTTQNRIDYYLFQGVKELYGKEYKLNEASLIGGINSDIEPFLIAAQSVSLDSYKYCGDVYTLNRFMDAFNKAKMIKDNHEHSEQKINKDSIMYVNKTSNDNGYYLTGELNVKTLAVKADETATNIKDTVGKILGDIKTSLFNKEVEQKINEAGAKVKSSSELAKFAFRWKDISGQTVHYSKSLRSDLALVKNWEENDIFNDVNFKERQESIIATRAKTIYQLRLEHDLSWYFDENGKSKKDYKIVNTIDELEWYCKNVFPKIKLWSVDIESTGLNMFNGRNPEHFDHTVSIMVSWKKDQALFFPINMAYIANLPGTWVAHLKYWLEKIPAVGHNIGFDARGLFSDFGIRLNVKHDTQILNFNRNCYRAKRANGLKHLEHMYLGVDTLELKDIFRTNKLAGLFRYLTEDLALLYACPDVDMDLKLFYYLYERLPVSARKGYQLDMLALRECWEMDSIGNRVDQKKAKLFRDINNADRDLLAGLIYRIVGQKIALDKKMDELTSLSGDDELSVDEISEKIIEYMKSEEYKNAKYTDFKLTSGKDLARIFFKILEYPEQAWSDKPPYLPKVDAGVLEKLIKIKRKVPDDYLKNDIQSMMSQYDPEAEPLVKAKDFNETKCPVALLLMEWRLREKRDTTFFKQLLDTAVDEYYYTSSKLANAETFRIINTIQTLQGYMKKMIIPYDDDFYMIVFDFSQIEYRYMAGMAHVKALVESLNHVRADFHRECCALLHNIKAWLVTNKMRKEGKSLNFAIPYGMGVYSICQQLYKKVTRVLIPKAQQQLNLWQEKFHEIWDYLETRRDEALANGFVSNNNGRCRWFYDDENETLEEWKKNRTKGRIGAIRRAAGNYPIQSGAADLFKMALIRFRKRLREEGLGDLVKTTALIHDEMVNSVHKSVNPYYLYKIIAEEVMFQIEGHPRYYAGVSVVDNWYEGKADEYEAPIEFLQYIISSPLAQNKFLPEDKQDPKKMKLMVYNDIHEYMSKVFKKEFAPFGCDIDKSNVIDLRNLMANMEDYFLRERMSVYYKVPKTWKKPDFKMYENDGFIRAFEQYALAEGSFDEYKILLPKDYPLGTTEIGRAHV